MVTLWPLAQKSRVQSQAETVSFPIGKAAEDEGSFGKVDGDDGEGLQRRMDEKEEREEESTSPHVDDAGRRTHCRHLVFRLKTRLAT